MLKPILTIGAVLLTSVLSTPTSGDFVEPDLFDQVVTCPNRIPKFPLLRPTHCRQQLKENGDFVEHFIGLLDIASGDDIAGETPEAPPFPTYLYALKTTFKNGKVEWKTKSWKKMI